MACQLPTCQLPTCQLPACQLPFNACPAEVLMLHSSGVAAEQGNWVESRTCTPMTLCSKNQIAGGAPSVGQ